MNSELSELKGHDTYPQGITADAMGALRPHLRPDSAMDLMVPSLPVAQARITREIYGRERPERR